jgi:hypothetical protein
MGRSENPRLDTGRLRYNAHRSVISRMSPPVAHLLLNPGYKGRPTVGQQPRTSIFTKSCDRQYNPTDGSRKSRRSWGGFVQGTATRKTVGAREVWVRIEKR